MSWNSAEVRASSGIRRSQQSEIRRITSASFLLVASAFLAPPAVNAQANTENALLAKAAAEAEQQLKQTFTNLQFDDFEPAPVKGAIYQASAGGRIVYYAPESEHLLFASVFDKNGVNLTALAQEAGLTANIGGRHHGIHVAGVAGYLRDHIAPAETDLLERLECRCNPVTEHAIARRPLKRIIEAHEKAVDAAVGWLEDYALLRRRVSGKEIHETTGRLLFARFTEHSSRELDPHLHTHVVVLNMTNRGRGAKMVSLETLAMYTEQVTAGQIYRNDLAHRLRELGYEIDFDPRKGLFDIRGVRHADRLEQAREGMLRGRAERAERRAMRDRDEVFRPASLAELIAGRAHRAADRLDTLLRGILERVDQADPEQAPSRQHDPEPSRQGHDR